MAGKAAVDSRFFAEGIANFKGAQKYRAVIGSLVPEIARWDRGASGSSCKSVIRLKGSCKVHRCWNSLSRTLISLQCQQHIETGIL